MTHGFLANSSNYHFSDLAFLLLKVNIFRTQEYN